MDINKSCIKNRNKNKTIGREFLDFSMVVVQKFSAFSALAEREVKKFPRETFAQRTELKTLELTAFSAGGSGREAKKESSERASRRSSRRARAERAA